MDVRQADRGLALICDLAGTVTTILRDDLHAVPDTLLGRSFVYLLDTASLEKALSFLAELNLRGTVAAWELNLSPAQGFVPMRFAGIKQDDKLLIVGAATDDDLMRLYEDLTRLNNELVNLQRQLTFKNRELQRLNAQKDLFLGMVAHDMRNSPAGNKGEMRAAQAPASALAEEPMPAAPPARARPCTVLLAEDNLPYQKIVLHLLRELGCEAEAVDTGCKVLEALNRRPFDLVLMDVRMPEMDGIEATRRLRRELPREVQPIVYALTAGVAENEVQLCLDAGMDGFLSKPVVRAELAALCTGNWS